MRKFAWIAVVAILTGCGGNPLGVRFDSSVPGDQQGLMQMDLGRVSSLSLAPPSGNDLSYLNIGSPTGPAVADWLGQRMSIVVGETFDYDSLKRLAAIQTLSENASATTVMMNLGSYLYLDGKEKGRAYFLRLGSGEVAITTPRVNIVQIGEGLFTVNSIKSVGLDAMANSFLRIATYIHEGRHSDGNGTNAGFPHAKCTSGSYSGLYACENNLNGPYAIQAIFLRLVTSGCVDCTQTELAGLQLSLADYQSRLIGYQFPDASPEGI